MKGAAGKIQQLIIDSPSNGLTVAEIAENLGLTRSCVRGILSRKSLADKYGWHLEADTQDANQRFYFLDNSIYHKANPDAILSSVKREQNLVTIDANTECAAYEKKRIVIYELIKFQASILKKIQAELSSINKLINELSANNKQACKSEEYHSCKRFIKKINKSITVALTADFSSGIVSYREANEKLLVQYENVAKLKNLAGRVAEAAGAQDNNGQPKARASVKPFTTMPVFKSVILKRDQTGYSYDTLFGSCFKGARRIVLVEPYLNWKIQINNIKILANTIIKFNKNTILIEDVKLHICTKPFFITPLHNKKTKSIVKPFVNEEEREKYLIYIRAMLEIKNIKLSWEYDNYLHDRHIFIDNGIKINLSRGLDIYNSTNFNLYRPQHERQIAKDTEITYFYSSNEELSEYMSKIPNS